MKELLELAEKIIDDVENGKITNGTEHNIRRYHELKHIKQNANGNQLEPLIRWRQFPSKDLPNDDCFLLVWRPGFESAQTMFFSWVNDTPENGGGWYLTELDGNEVKDIPLIKDEDAFPTHWMPSPELPTA
jgi:hypothetical protein